MAGVANMFVVQTQTQMQQVLQGQQNIQQGEQNLQQGQ